MTNARSDIPSRIQGDRLANYLTMVGHLCADINQGALSAILPFLVVGAGYSYLEATMLLFASNIASGIIQPLFGWLGDRFPCPWFMALGVFLGGVGMAAIGFVGSYWLVLLSAMVSGIGIALVHPEGGRLANLAAGEHKGTGMSIFAVGGNIGFFVGPLLCAAFVGGFGLSGTWIFLVPALPCAVVLLAFNGRFRALGTSRDNPVAAREDKEHWGLFAIVMGVLSLKSIVSYGLLAFVPLFMVANLGQSDTASSMVLSAFAIFGAVATAISGKVAERFGAIRLAIVCCVALGIGLVAYGLSGNVVLAIAIAMFLSMSSSLFHPSTIALGMDYIPLHLGMASGLCYGVTVCIGGVVEPFLGMAGDALGLTAVFCIMAAIAFAAALLAGILKRYDKLKLPM
ncbi:MAG: MFS transporter [Coriobacteriales bacterium]